LNKLIKVVPINKAHGSQSSCSKDGRIGKCWLTIEPVITQVI